ncbi:MAG: glycoside hydrolase family 2 TIM barrel-domain containing protein [Tannerellaceae bacterium]
MKRITVFLLLLLLAAPVWAAHQPEFSTAGFFRVKDTGREVYSMNPAWRFYKGAQAGAEQTAFNDRNWSVVSLPNGIEYVPTEASGCINYQGEVWYRKHFTPDEALKGKQLFLHFEAIMGKSKVYVNGQLLTEHFGGYLPVIADLTKAIRWGEENVIAVWADNSDDPSYPPGKPQDVLDFTYFGGIYRDCWLVAHNNIYITDPNRERTTAGGGLFVAYDKVSEASADILLKTQVRNATSKAFTGIVEYVLQTQDGKQVAIINSKIRIKAGQAASVDDRLTLANPLLWSPEKPTLYNLLVYIRDKEGTIIDGYRRRIGIRSIEFKGIDGFWLNGKPYEKPLIGANRHQDFAIVGNAVPNSLHWRDAKKLKDVGMEVVRNAHCPQDPAFMDACDELGLFVIVNTPGWQFWNDAPIFAERVFDDIRNLVRRDRNHPSVWLWEPILNETWYPADFAKKTRDLVDTEYPYPYCYSGSDSEARGNEHFPIHFCHPANADKEFSAKKIDPNRCYFTREWGDNVDDWSSHNSPSRVARNWGEQPMLIQAQHYAHPAYNYTCFETLFQTSRQHMGGCLWHSFDHQRGYHPDPFYGGLMDVFRQPKYSYYLFMAQRPPVKDDRIAETGPMVYIAHEMTPFSGKDVVVYSNCDEVRLTVNKGGKQYTYKKDPAHKGMPSPVITFPDVYNFMTDKAMSRDKKQADVCLTAEGLMDGKVVATHQVVPARRPEKLMLWVDNEGTSLEANGSDVVTVVAAVADKQGNIKRLNNYFITFQIEGEGRLLGGEEILANPAPVRWGTAPVLVQSTLKPGKIKVTARVLFEGKQMPMSGELTLESQPATFPQIYNATEAALISTQSATPSVGNSQSDAAREVERLQKELNALKLKEVEKQQTDFGEKR